MAGLGPIFCWLVAVNGGTYGCSVLGRPQSVSGK